MSCARVNKLKPIAPRPSSETSSPSNSSSSAATNLRATPPSPMPQGTASNRNAFAGQNLGVPCSPLESLTSVNPKDYVWGTPTPQQQQQLYQQFAQMAFFCFMAQQQAMCQPSPVPPQLPFNPFTPGMCSIPPPGFPGGLQSLAGILPTCPPSGVAPVPVPPELPNRPQQLPAVVPAPQNQAAGAPRPAGTTSSLMTHSDSIVQPVSTANELKSGKQGEYGIELNVDDIQKLLDEPLCDSPQGTDMGSSCCVSDTVALRAESPGTSISTQRSCLLFAGDDALPLEDDFQAALGEMDDIENVGSFDDISLDEFLAFPEEPSLLKVDRVASVDSSEDTLMKEAVLSLKPQASSSVKRCKALGGIRKHSARSKPPGLPKMPVKEALQALQGIMNAQATSSAQQLSNQEAIGNAANSVLSC